MKTVAIVGSPRKDGNCDILVNKLLEKLMVKKVFTILMNWISVFVKPVRLVKKVTV